MFSTVGGWLSCTLCSGNISSGFTATKLCCTNLRGSPLSGNVWLTVHVFIRRVILWDINNSSAQQHLSLPLQGQPSFCLKSPAAFALLTQDNCKRHACLLRSFYRKLLSNLSCLFLLSLIQFYLLATGHCSSLSGFTQSKHPFHHIY